MTNMTDIDLEEAREDFKNALDYNRVSKDEVDKLADYQLVDTIIDKAKLAHTLMANVQEVLDMEPHDLLMAKGEDYYEQGGENSKLAEIKAILRRGL